MPFFKQGDRTDPANYRPVSVLPLVSKIYEKVMYNRLVQHLEINNLFDRQQHGLRRGKSTVTALVEFVESIVEAIDKGELPIGIFMDLSKAFDSLSHKTLLKKLRSMGINNIHLK